LSGRGAQKRPYQPEGAWSDHAVRAAVQEVIAEQRNEDDCAFCGAYNDPMGNDEALTRKVEGQWLTWCGIDCLRGWAEKRRGVAERASEGQS
jgi:hypothetical protein